MQQASVDNSVQTIQSLMRFDGPPREFLQAILKFQCDLTSALGGVAVHLDAQNQPQILGAYPQALDNKTPRWLTTALDCIRQGGLPDAIQMLPIEDALPSWPDAGVGSTLVVLPTHPHTELRAALAIALQPMSERERNQRADLLAWSLHLLGVYERGMEAKRQHAEVEALLQTIHTFTQASQAPQFEQMAQEICSAAASRWRARRVSLGLLQGRNVKLLAVSPAMSISRRETWVQHLEAAMEECLDQNVEIMYPADEKAQVISRATAELSWHNGPSAVLSLPVYREDVVAGVLMLERDAQQPFTDDELELLRMLCDMASPRLLQLYDRKRWWHTQFAQTCSEVLAHVIGRRHQGWKLVGILLIVVAAALIFIEGPYRVTSPFTIEPSARRVVPAAFDGYLKSVEVEPGDQALAGQTLLATLQTDELQDQQRRLRSQYQTHRKEAADARSQRKEVEAQIALAQAAQVASELRAVRRRLEQAQVLAPADGIVMGNDLKDRIGGPVSQGEPLFELAPTKRFEAVLHVPDNRIGQLAVGQRGYLSTTAYPSIYLPFEVVRIEPVASTENNANTFTVLARLLESPDWLMSGMRGRARVVVGERPYGYLWTRDLINWIRMRLWI